MRFELRITTPLRGLEVRIRAAAAAEGGERDEGGARVALPSTSRLRDPAMSAGLFRFEDPPEADR